MSTNRIRNTIFNGISNLILNISVAIISFALRTLFIRTLGEQCLGLDGLFTNILSLLSLAELGFSTSISFSLYKPLATNDIKKVNQLMTYFKKVYQKIGLFIFLFGLLILPFLKIIAKDYTIDYNIYVIYLLYLINTAVSYYISYITILIEADQKLYKLTTIKFASNIITYGTQAISLVIFKNFIFYLLIQFVFRMVERIIIFLYIKKRYNNLDLKTKSDLDLETKCEISKNIKGIIFHKIGDYAVNGTDNMLISSIINISTTGIYYNYVSITAILKNIIAAIVNATTASFGNLNVTEDCSTKRNVFELINFLGLFFSGISVVGVYFCINPFISLWIGPNFLLDSFCVIVICINLYLNSILLPVDAVKSSSGLYYNDRFVPLIQSIINLIVSITMGIKFGLIGILLGTTISGLLTVNWTKSYVIYRNLFNNSPVGYYLSILKNVCCIILTIFISKIILTVVNVNNNLIAVIFYGFISVILYIIAFTIVNFKAKEFKYFIGFLKKKTS